MTEAQQQEVARLSELLGNPNVQQYQSMLKKAEGTAQYADPYRVAGGGSATLPDLTKYHRMPWGFKTKSGETKKSTAAGAYQFTEATWNDAATALGLTDFSPRSQDLAALWLMSRSGSLDDVASGAFGPALQKDNKVWASLPGSPYDQNTRSPEYIAQALGQPGNSAKLDLGPKSVRITPGVVATGDTDRELAALGRISAEKVDDPMKMRMLDTQQMLSALPEKLQRDAPLFDDLPTMFDDDLRHIIKTV